MDTKPLIRPIVSQRSTDRLYEPNNHLFFKSLAHDLKAHRRSVEQIFLICGTDKPSSLITKSYVQETHMPANYPRPLDPWDCNRAPRGRDPDLQT